LLTRHLLLLYGCCCSHLLNWHSLHRLCWPSGSHYPLAATKRLLLLLHRLSFVCNCCMDTLHWIAVAWLLSPCGADPAHARLPLLTVEGPVAGKARRNPAIGLSV
jgi:hypothetical protein